MTTRRRCGGSLLRQRINAVEPHDDPGVLLIAQLDPLPWLYAQHRTTDRLRADVQGDAAFVLLRGAEQLFEAILGICSASDRPEREEARGSKDEQRTCPASNGSWRTEVLALHFERIPGV